MKNRLFSGLSSLKIKNDPIFRYWYLSRKVVALDNLILDDNIRGTNYSKSAGINLIVNQKVYFNEQLLSVFLPIILMTIDYGP